jgi:predicted MFS family arabinose efflux permease
MSAGFVLSFNVAAVSALIPSVAETLKVEEFLAGKVVWLYMLPYGLAALLYGPLARGVEYKKILLLCIGGLSATNVLAGIASHIYVLFAARILAGISGAAIIPLSLILIATTSPAGQRGKKVGGFFSLTFISTLLGVFLSGVIFWRWIFLLAGILAALVALGIYLYFPEFSGKKERVRFRYLQVLSDKHVYRLFVYIFSMSFLFHGIRQWLGVYFSTMYGFEQFFISMLLTTISLSGILGESLGGVLADRLGRIKVVNVGVLLMITTLIILLFKNGMVVLFALMFVWGLGWTFNHAGISTNLCDLPHRLLHESTSLNSAVRFLSGGLGAVFGGMVAQRSFRVEFAVFAGCLLLLVVFSKKLLLTTEAVTYG